MLVFLSVLCSSILIDTSHVYTTSSARDSSISFEIVNSTFKFFVYDYKGWKCTVNIDGSTTDIIPPNQRGLPTKYSHYSQITFYFLEDLIFSIQFIIDPNLIQPSCVLTHPNDD
ncbi:hypothetical protein TVAG_311850 [Trichomonas vaginalis G3]|uniref:Uncharacterized protein n=1 Tax=Trichomonas vaginalis (strain ATCC PRA-98 / G3) TaxID=412133 RepID=A2EJZ1_TRIV3|nr:hypothetical protein TVAG_311850 [Trichomonas vaginalis G3]|eukprot:XP_001319282.1 hypothetical protein [Trichomonas vaginalis G3]